jgi:p24 family protein gamma-5
MQVSWKFFIDPSVAFRVFVVSTWIFLFGKSVKRKFHGFDF